MSAPAGPRTGAPPRSSPLALQLALLATATFVYVTFEILPVGLIGDISADLHVSQGRVGLLITGYAIVAGIATVPSVAIAARWSRKQALLCSLVVLAVAEVIAATSTGYAMLTVSRVLAALMHGVLWSLVAPVAASLAPRERVGMATASVFAGATAAAVVGSPLSAVVGHALGWRWAAGLLAVLTVATSLGLVFALPPDRRVSQVSDAGGVRQVGDAGGVSQMSDTGGVRQVPDTGGVRQVPDAGGARRVGTLRICVIAVIVVFAQFLSYTYFSPLIGHIVGGAGPVAACLALFGAAGAVATVLMGRYSDAAPARAVVLAVAAVAVGTGAVAVCRLPLPGWLAGIVLVLGVAWWGAGYAAVGPSLQSGLIRVAGDRMDSASSVYVTCYQVGIASGSAVGALGVGPMPGLLPLGSSLAGGVALLVTVRSRAVFTART